MSRMLRAALELADADWPVFPLNGKKPLAGSHGHLDATTDPRQIRRWWKEDPRYNIGSPVPENLLVLDVDPRNKGDLSLLERRVGAKLPRTLEVISGRRDGGRHLYYMRPFERPYRGNIPAGIDVKTNGYMVMPPSLHPDTGKPYLWIDCEVATLPREVIKLMLPRRSTRRKPANGGVAPLVTFIRGLKDGERHDGLFWAANRAHESGVGQRGLEMIVDAAEDMGFSAREAWRVVESARERPGS